MKQSVMVAEMVADSSIGCVEMGVSKNQGPYYTKRTPNFWKQTFRLCRNTSALPLVCSGIHTEWPEVLESFAIKLARPVSVLFVSASRRAAAKSSVGRTRKHPRWHFQNVKGILQKRAPKL